MHDSILVSIKTDPRIVACAVFIGKRIDFTDSRQLAAGFERAESSAIAFVRWLLSAYQVGMVAIETVDDEGDLPVRRVRLSNAIIAMLRQAGVPVWEVSRTTLFSAYGVPPLKNRLELREIASSFWPVLNSRRYPAVILDAAALGLYVQVERQLSI